MREIPQFDPITGKPNDAGDANCNLKHCSPSVVLTVSSTNDHLVVHEFLHAAANFGVGGLPRGCSTESHDPGVCDRMEQTLKTILEELKASDLKPKERVSTPASPKGNP